MKKLNRTILCLILFIAVITYNIASSGLTYTNTANAHSEFKMQNSTEDCHDEDINCVQKQAENCDNCMGFHNNCHNVTSLISVLSFNFPEPQSIFVSLYKNDFSFLNYPPEAPPA